MPMLTPATPRDWIALLVISLLGVAALVWVLPWTARHPFVVPPDLYDRMNPVKKPFAGLMNLTPVIAGVVVVTACLLLYAAWMSWSVSQPVVKTSHRRGSSPP
jgi:hypothetical protein